MCPRDRRSSLLVLAIESVMDVRSYTTLILVFQEGCKTSGRERPADRAKVQAVRPKDHHPLEFESASSCGQDLRAARDVYCLQRRGGPVLGSSRRHPSSACEQTTILQVHTSRFNSATAFRCILLAYVVVESGCRRLYHRCEAVIGIPGS